MTTKKIKHYRYIFAFTAFAALSFLIIFLLSQRLHPVYGIIDTHEHIGNAEKATILLDADNISGIEKTILLASPLETLTLNGRKSFTKYRENFDEILKIIKTYPDRFIPFCTVNPIDTDALEYLKDCINRGGKGIKLYNGHSYYYDIFQIPLDSPGMMPIYAYAEENSIPVLYHVNIANYGDELENVLKKYPDLIVSVPHFMVSSTNLEKVARLFDLYPNLYTDVSFGSPQFFASGFIRISDNTKKYIEFINKYSDRILFGTDMVITETEYKDETFMEDTLMCYRNMLEKKNFTCAPVNDYYKGESEKNTEMYENCEPKDGAYCATKKEKMESFTRWYEETKKLNGLHLDSGLLQKIYKENALRFLSANK
jgi:predicted TIM-barrel fold metal-dependent hydrolase